MDSTQPDTSSQSQSHHQQNPGKALPKHKDAMDKLRDVVLRIANSDARGSLTANQKSLIEHCFSFFFRDFRSPDHPPYSAMIHRAITELNEKGGSSEESISQFMKKEYHDLPWAHFTLLKLHLSKLCDYGEIVVTHSRHYLLAAARPNVNLCTRPERAKLKRRQRSPCWYRPSKQHKKCTTQEDIKQRKGPMVVTKKQGKRIKEQDEVMVPNEKNVEGHERKNDILKLTNEVSEERNKADKPKNEVNENEAAEWQNNVIGNEAPEQENGLIICHGQERKQTSGIVSEQCQPQEQQNNMIEEQHRTQLLSLEGLLKP